MGSVTLLPPLGDHIHSVTLFPLPLLVPTTRWCNFGHEYQTLPFLDSLRTWIPSILFNKYSPDKEDSQQ